MIESILQIIVFLLPFVIEGVRKMMDEKTRKEARNYVNDSQTFDQALAVGDADAVTRMFDELSTPADPGGGDPGGQDGEEAAER